MQILITGAAGFIGYHLIRRLLNEDIKILGVDNFSDYYDIQLKKNRILEIEKNDRNHSFNFKKLDISNRNELMDLFDKHEFSHVINLAAQAGVRYSLTNPNSYIDSNIVGFANILEGCRNQKIKHLIYASSSSVYGLNEKYPYSVNDNVDHPISIYSASKKSNELMAHAYSHLFNIPSTGLRLFTVYGPWGRPDMALHLFTTAIINKEPINVFNNGKMLRDFTYIDDVVEYIFRIINLPPKSSTLSPATSSAPWRILNIGCNNPIELNKYIATLEKKLGMQANKVMLPMQPCDVRSTWADMTETIKLTHYTPSTSLEEGISKFVDWYHYYYKK